MVGLRSVLALQQIYRPVRTAPGHRDVGDADVEEVSALELQVTEIERAVARIVEHRDFDRMRAVRKDLLRGEVALRVDRNLAAHDPNRVVRRYAAALHGYRAAAEQNLVAGKVVLTVGGEQLARRPLIFRHWNLIGRRIAV